QKIPIKRGSSQTCLDNAEREGFMQKRMQKRSRADTSLAKNGTPLTEGPELASLKQRGLPGVHSVPFS
ncbi:MAG: hypothetical protein LIP00_00385, partial [Parabacteroides sp.]|nr:hypothetical protein [Parabacteroides sp.]